MDWVAPEFVFTRLNDFPRPVHGQHGVGTTQLRNRTGASVPLLGGHLLDTDTAERFHDTLARALDPGEIEALADEHRAATA